MAWPDPAIKGQFKFKTYEDQDWDIEDRHLQVDLLFIDPGVLVVFFWGGGSSCQCLGGRSPCTLYFDHSFLDTPYEFIFHLVYHPLLDNRVLHLISRCRSLLKATVTSKWRRRVASRRRSWTRFHLGPTRNGTGGAKKVDGSISTRTLRASKACDTNTFWAEEKLFIIDFVNESAKLAIRLLHISSHVMLFSAEVKV